MGLTKYGAGSTYSTVMFQYVPVMRTRAATVARVRRHVAKLRIVLDSDSDVGSETGSESPK